jgi:DNA-directed RNA polymerase subunit M/transcription elongation factor TFIIS
MAERASQLTGWTPSQPMPILPEHDRRTSARRAEPHCPACARDQVRVTVRTSMVIYYRCDECGHIWPEQKPGKSSL